MEWVKKSDRKTRWIDCYNSSQKILLVGEGDFSFSACLARAFGTAKNIVATSYLDEDSLVEKHWTGIPHLEELEKLGCVLLDKVDVYKMNSHAILKKTKFDIIIFNFPHAGHYDNLHEYNKNLIQMHRKLVGGFFKSASKMLSEGGEVHIRHRDDYPYDGWGVVSLAGKVGLKLKEKVLFDKSEYFGYHQKRGGSINTNKTFPVGYAFTFKFALEVPKADDQDHGGEIYVPHMIKDDVNVQEMVKDLAEKNMKNDVDDNVVDMLKGLCIVGDDKEKSDNTKNKEDKEDYNNEYYNDDYFNDKFEYDNPW